MATENKAVQEQPLQKGPPATDLGLFDEMERQFENFFTRGWLRPSRWDWPRSTELGRVFEKRLPRVDVIDRDSDIIVKAELPGIDKKDLEVSSTEDSVTIKGSTRREEKEEKGDFYRSEITTGSFERTVSLPASVDNSKVKASFKDGLLKLVFPKIEARKRRSISVE